MRRVVGGLLFICLPSFWSGVRDVLSPENTIDTQCERYFLSWQLPPFLSGKTNLGLPNMLAQLFLTYLVPVL